MRGAKKTTPRELAVTILARVDQHGAYADILLDGSLQTNALSEPDRRLLTQIVYGTLRWRGRVVVHAHPAHVEIHPAFGAQILAREGQGHRAQRGTASETGNIMRHGSATVRLAACVGMTIVPVA